VRWSGYEPQITTPVSFELITVEPNFSDTVVPRVGVEVAVHRNLALLAGYNFQKSPAQDRFGYANFVDTDRHVFSLGLEGAYSGFRLQGYFQYQWAVPRDFQKDPAYGEDFSAGGQVFSSGFNLSASF